METLLQSRSLIQRAFWLVQLRWIAIGGLAAATLVASRLMNVELPASRLYVLSVILLAYNFILYDLIRFFTWGDRKISHRTVSNIIVFQIAADLFILTTILHFSGGIENPFFLYFVFHMVLTSIFLSRFQSYIVATLGVFFFGGLILLEYLGVLEHYTLRGFTSGNDYHNAVFVGGTFLIFTTTLYLVVYMTTSITRQLHSQQADLGQANVLLQQKDHLKNEYVMRLTHDIKGHLAAIESCLDVVLHHIGGEMSDKQRDLTERAYRRANKCMGFIGALLRLTRMKLSGQVDMSEFPLRNIIMDSLAAVEGRVKEKSIRISYEIDESIDEIYGEPVLLGEAITNMLFNAARYTPRGGDVRLEIKDEGQTVLVKVKDTGIGIPPGEEEKIFEEFYRAANAREVERDSTGLGLSIVRQVIQRHRGHVWAQNNESGGSTFSFRIPKKALQSLDS
jgi:signal transduction histidine kinase